MGDIENPQPSTSDNRTESQPKVHEGEMKGPSFITTPRFYRTNRLKCLTKRNWVGSEKVCPTTNRLFQNDTLNTELIYYVGILQDILPSLSVHGDRRKIVPWIKKLFSPEFQVERLRQKRNKYLLHLVLITLSDSVFGIFKDPPMIGALPDIEDLHTMDRVSEARWEKDRYWEELLIGISEGESVMKCFFHEYCDENENEGREHAVAGSLLDEEFMFFLYLARPLVSLIPDLEQKSRTALWIFTLAKVRPDACLTMKAVRNDYMQAFLGYLQDLRLAGPFCNKPPENGETLKPLREVVRITRMCNPNKSLTDPTSEEAEDFLSEQPIPESGAFCYIAVTGNAKDPEKVSTLPLSTTKYDYYLGI